LANEHADTSVRSINLSEGFKAKLDDAEYEAKKTLIIQDDLDRLTKDKQIETKEKFIEEETIKIRMLKL
jgi:hypothetical protein